MCSVCFTCCPPRTACVVIGILQIFIHISLFVANNQLDFIKEISYASDTHSTITMVILTTIGIISALILIYGAAKGNIFCLQLWTAINTLIITAFVIGLIYCAYVAKDKSHSKPKSAWDVIMHIFSPKTYKKFFAKIFYYVTLIVIITVELFITFIGHDLTREVILEKRLRDLGRRSTDSEDDDSPRHHRSRRHRKHHSRRERDRRRRHHSHRRRRHHSNERGSPDRRRSRASSV